MLIQVFPRLAPVHVSHRMRLQTMRAPGFHSGFTILPPSVLPRPRNAQNHTQLCGKRDSRMVCLAHSELWGSLEPFEPGTAVFHRGAHSGCSKPSGSCQTPTDTSRCQPFLLGCMGVLPFANIPDIKDCTSILAENR